MRSIFLLPLLLLGFSGVYADPADLPNTAYLQVKLVGDEGQTVKSMDYSVHIEKGTDEAILNRHMSDMMMRALYPDTPYKTSGQYLSATTQKTFGPFPVGDRASVFVFKAMDDKGFVSRLQTQDIRLKAGTNILTMPLKFNQWEFTITGIHLQYDSTVPANLRNKAQGHLLLYLPNEHITNPTEFPIESAPLGKNTVATPYAEYYSDNGLYGITRVDVKPGTSSIALTIPVKLRDPELVHRYNLMLMVTDVDQNHPVTRFKTLMISADGKENIKSNTSQDTFYYTKLIPNTPYFFCVTAQDDKNRVASNCTTVNYPLPKDQVLDPLYVKVLGLKFVDSPANIQVQKEGKTESLPSFEDIIKLLDSNDAPSKTTVTSSPEITAQQTVKPSKNKETILFWTMPLISGDLDNYAKPAILDPQKFCIAVQYADGSQAILDGPQAIALMRAHGLLVPNSFALTSVGRHGYETPPAPPKPKPVIATPPRVTTPPPDVYWLFELKLDVKAVRETGQGGIGYYYDWEHEPTETQALAEFKRIQQPKIGKGIYAPICGYRDRKTHSAEGIIADWSIQLIGGPYATEAEVARAKKAVDCF